MAQDVNVKINVNTSDAQKQSNDLKNRMRELKIEMENLAMAGQQNTAEFQKVQTEYANLVDLSGDLSAATRILADDYFKETAAMEGLSVGVNIFSGLTQAAALCGVENKDLQETLVKLQAAQNLANVAMNISKALNKDTALMTALRTVKTNALTAAQTKNTTATAAGSAATAGFATAEGVATTASGALVVGIKAVGTAIKSIPVVGWILAAIAALTTLITLIVQANDEETEGERIAQLQIQAQQQLNDARAEGVRAVQKDKIELDMALETMQQFPEDTAEWGRAVDTISKKLGVSKDWIRKNQDQVAQLADTWVKVAQTQATADELTKRLAKNRADQLTIETEINRINNLSYDEREDALDELVKNYGLSASYVDKINEAMHDQRTSNEKDWRAATNVLNGLVNQMKSDLSVIAQPLESALKETQKELQNLRAPIDDAIAASQELEKQISKTGTASQSAVQKAQDTQKKAEEAFDKFLEGRTKARLDAEKKANDASYEGKLKNIELEKQAITENYEAMLDYAEKTYGFTSEKYQELSLLMAEELDKVEEKKNALIKAEEDRKKEQEKNEERAATDSALKIAKAESDARLIGLKEGSDEYIDALEYQYTVEYDTAMEALNRQHEDGLISEEEYLSQKFLLQKEYEDKVFNLKKEQEEHWNELKWQGTQEILSKVSELTNAMMEAELESVGDNEQKQAEVRKKYAKMNFVNQIASIGISTAKAIMETWAAYGEIPFVGPILAGVQTALIAGIGIAQTVKAKQTMNQALSGKAARGAFINGRSHSQGGELWELEGGEAVLNKKAMAIPAFKQLASAMNESTGGVSFGNTVSVGSSSSKPIISAGVSDETVQKIVSDTVAGIAEIPVVVTEHRITEAQRRVEIINSQASF